MFDWSQPGAAAFEELHCDGRRKVLNESIDSVSIPGRVKQTALKFTKYARAKTHCIGKLSMCAVWEADIRRQPDVTMTAWLSPDKC